MTGVLRVGPASAGSVPGPVCCGFGGTEPTVTDANAVLGRLNPDGFFAGRRRLDIDAARAAIEARLARSLDASVEATATAVLRIVDSAMGDLIRNLTIERGLDPRDFTIVAYGGGGPLHVGSYARELGVRTAIIPRVAPVYSAWGITDSPALRSFSLSAPTALPAQSSVISTVFGELGKRAANALGSNSEASSHERFVDMRYHYQQQELRVPILEDELARGDLSEVLMSRFEQLYEERFGAATTFRGAGIEISTFRHMVSENLEDEMERRFSASQTVARQSKREVYFDGVEIAVPVHDADAAALGFDVEGPCIVEGQLMTIVVHPRQSLSLGVTGDFVLTLDSVGPSTTDRGLSL